MKKIKISLVIVLALVLSACAYNASLVKTSYDILKVSQTSYDTSMKVVADLYKRGEIGAEKKNEIVAVANTYSQAHNAAVEALAQYEESKSLDDKELLEQRISMASSALIDLLSILKPYIGEE